MIFLKIRGTPLKDLFEDRTWKSSAKVLSGRTISGLHIGPSPCELKEALLLTGLFDSNGKKGYLLEVFKSLPVRRQADQ